MTQAATLYITLAIPQSAGAMPQPPFPLPPGTSIFYTQAIAYPEIVISGAATTSLLDFSLLPAGGAQVLLIQIDPMDNNGLALTAPVGLNIGGMSHATITAPAGSQIAWVMPSASAGASSCQIVTTAPAVVRVWAAG